MKPRETVLSHLDIAYSHDLAKRMEQFRSNEALGYRTAGSKAEFETGEMLRAEMERIGLFNVTKDAVSVDGWEFKKAVLSFFDEAGRAHSIQLGAYQTTFVTNGPQEFSLCFVGKGTEQDYEHLDVSGKLVLVEINQRDEWWINYPVYEAHLRGAAALIAVQSGGYGEIDDEALNAQDIAGPEDAPAFSISRRDASVLFRLLKERGELTVSLDADTRVLRDATTYNIVGYLPGRHPERKILLSAHYDSYFSGFQDDNTAVSMMLGIAKALIESGYQPENTLVFCAMAAEEWGVADSNFAWSTGAYEQVFTAHPEWPGSVIAALNFELPALAHGTRARIRSCYEYTPFLSAFLSELPMLTAAYPEEPRVTAPIETWSDDFSLAISGIPSMVNDFTGGSFMETHYHSQFDNDGFYDEQVYRLHHEIFVLLVQAFDQTAAAPLCFSPVMERAKKALDASLPDGLEQLENGIALCAALREKSAALCALLSGVQARCDEEYAALCRENERYAALLSAGETAQADALYAALRPLEASLLSRFRAEQDAFVRIDWYGNVFYPHEILWENLRLLTGAARNLRAGSCSSALRKLYQLDNNAYAFMFSEEVYRHFTHYVFDQPKGRLKWGYGRLMQHEDLSPVVRSLLKKQEQSGASFAEEAALLEGAAARCGALLLKTLAELSQTVQKTFMEEKDAR